jgi:pimeloyl-ACP methyl ester carboxylesterase
MQTQVPVIALPGGVMPAAIRYAAVASQLNGAASLHAKDLEVYATDAPPPGYAVEHEVEAVARFADSLGLDRFHLLGYSGGGFVALAFAGTHPDRLLSLALFEPASIPGELSPDEQTFWARLRAGLVGLEGPAFMQAFTRVHLREGVQAPPPDGPPPPWMRTRPAGLATLMAAFEQYRFDRARLRECPFPVFLGYGDLTGEHEEVRAAILAGLFPDVHIRRFAGIHHFAPPQDIYTTDHVEELRRLWAQAAIPATPR